MVWCNGYKKRLWSAWPGFESRYRQFIVSLLYITICAHAHIRTFSPSHNHTFEYIYYYTHTFAYLDFCGIAPLRIRKSIHSHTLRLTHLYTHTFTHSHIRIVHIPTFHCDSHIRTFTQSQNRRFYNHTFAHSRILLFVQSHIHTFAHSKTFVCTAYMFFSVIV